MPRSVHGSRERLSLVSAALAARLANGLEDSQLRQACSAFLLPLMDRTGLAENPAVRRASRVLADGLSNEGSRRVMKQLALLLDQRYVDVAQLAAEGSASESDVLTAFAEARAASALAAALGPDPVFAAQEAAYEAHCAIADGSNVLALLSEAIDA